MFKKIKIPLTHRSVVFKHGIPIRALGPGKHTLWGSDLSTFDFDTDELVFDAPSEVLGVLPKEWFGEVRLEKRQRGVLYHGGSPKRFLRPGTHRFWTVDPSVVLQVMSVDDPVPELTDELYALIPLGELVSVTVNHHQRCLKYVQGRFDAELGPGRYDFWSHPGSKVSVHLVDMRQQQLTIAGQELMTRDKVTLRLTLSVDYAPLDAPTLVHTVADIPGTIYLFTQLATRDYVAGVTLDELLEGRDAMTRYLEQVVVPKGRAIGVEVRSIGVKDIVLPGEMKELLNRVIEAEKEAAANVILRREEAAVTRQMANAAKVIADNPVLLELKRLEALKEIAPSIGKVHLMLGEGGLKLLGHAGLFRDDG